MKKNPLPIKRVVAIGPCDAEHFRTSMKLIPTMRVKVAKKKYIEETREQEIVIGVLKSKLSEVFI